MLCDRDPIERWIDGRVALLGDAAHPMLQYFAQGACQAMEDAVCLSHMLGAHPDDHEAALEQYRAQRFPRTARVQLLSRAIGEHIYHPDGEHARLRNAIMGAKSVGGLLRRPGVALWRDGAGGVRTKLCRRPGLEPGAISTGVHLGKGWSGYLAWQRHWWLWVPAFAGTTLSVSIRVSNPYQRLTIDLSRSGLRQLVE